MRLRRSTLALFFAGVLLSRFALADDTDFNPPPTYYNSATGLVDTALKSQLLTIMSTGQLSSSYGDFRYSAAITDVDPNNPNNVLLVYNRASVPATWDPSPSALWNREHIWPQALQPGGDVSNSTTGHKADPFALRPVNPGINTSRGDKPYGLDATTGSYGAVTGTNYYFPGDADKGDAARSLFYSDTRWGPSLGISLTDSVPGSNQMGDLSSLIAWNYLDPPDTFERRRNQAIYSQTMNPTYYTNNRNAYIDHPEYVWSIYMNQTNDSKITIAAPTTVSADASSTTKTVNLGSVIVNAAVPAAQAFSLNKAGNNGTYFEVTTDANGFSPSLGRFNAFPIITGATDNRSISVGLKAGTSTAIAGPLTGTVTVDNLDITASGCGGAGCGANDGNDTFNVSLNVLDHAKPSFTSPSQTTSRTLDFGNIALGSSSPSLNLDVFNLNAMAGYTAALDLDGIAPTGNTSAFTTNLAPFSSLAAGGPSHPFTSSFIATSVGTFTAVYTLNLSDANLSGAQNTSPLLLTLTGKVRLAGDFDGDGTVSSGDYLVWRRSFGQTGLSAYSGADGDGNTIVDNSDYDVWRAHFGQTASGSGSALALSAAVPEPASITLIAIAILSCVIRRRF